MENEPKKTCQRCGEDFPSESKDTKAYCPACTIQMAEEHIPDVEEPLQLKNTEDQSERWKGILQWSAVAVSLLIMIIRIPAMQRIFEGPEPIRLGVYGTDSDTNRVIDHLWEISERIQQGFIFQEIEIRDPVTEVPYRIAKTDEDLIVEHPEPGLYGLRVLRVSKKSPAPEVLE